VPDTLEQANTVFGCCQHQFAVAEAVMHNEGCAAG
jgi:hypothetical protein